MISWLTFLPKGVVGRLIGFNVDVVFHPVQTGSAVENAGMNESRARKRPDIVKIDDGIVVAFPFGDVRVSVPERSVELRGLEHAFETDE